MKYCYNEATTLKNSTLERDIELAEKAGFEYIELWLCQIEQYLETHSIKELQGLFDGRTIRPFAFDSFEDILFSRDYKKLKEDFTRACQYGTELDVHNTVMVPSVWEGINDQYSKEEITEEAVSVLTELAEIARPYKMRLAFEPIGFEDCAVRSLKEAWEIVQKVNLDHVGLTLDVFNEYLYCGLNDIDDIKMLDPKKVFIFHIDDAPVLPLKEYKLDHSDRVPPGEGGLPYRKFVENLWKTGYDEAASVELFNPALYAMDAQDAINHCFTRVKDAIDFTR
ncbi:sugar phosphate isomerase/epimerase family protein [Christensenella hongkongensis]|uniref:sugar phosphate isomerase/epimerase family protein n=1 Tax=Christensenella hongkongensis TaxID=270498 RepID=UPI0026715B4D|nr:sugar phosphate isomerase/epimerase [Christensenella hongkongensis]